MDDEEFLDDEDRDDLGDFDLDDQEDFQEEIPAPPPEEPPELVPEPESVPDLDPQAPNQETPDVPLTDEEVGLVSPTELPVQLKIELGRLQLTANKLLHLKPGNFLELQRRIDQGVDLVVSGERIGRGELIRIGDAIGVRVTELG